MRGFSKEIPIRDVSKKGRTDVEAFYVVPDNNPGIGQDCPKKVADENHCKLRVFVIPHTHGDLSWPNIPEICVNSLVAAIGDTLRILKDRPEFRFTMEHMLYLREFIRRNPDRIDAIKDLIKKSILECGGFFTGPTELTLGAEGLVRELYFGKRWARNTLGVEASIVWNVDAMGHTLQLPQILAKAGIAFFVIWKDFGYHHPVFRKNFGGYEGPYLFSWAAPDGSKVTVCHTPRGYGGWTTGLRMDYQEFSERFKKFIEVFKPHLEKYDLPNILFVGEGSDIQRPSPQVVQNVRRWNSEVSEPQVKIASTLEFFREIKRYDLPTSSGEMPYWWDAVQALEENRVLRGRILEGRLLAAEGFSAIAELLDPTFEYPEDNINTAWEYRLMCNEHNWGGTNGAVSDEIRVTQTKSALIISSYVLDKALREIASQIEFKDEGIPIVVFNSLGWDRTDVVICRAEFEQKVEEKFKSLPPEYLPIIERLAGEPSLVERKVALSLVGVGRNSPILVGQRELLLETSGIKNISLKDSQGNHVPIQIVESSRNRDGTLREAEIMFKASVPSFGYATYYLVPTKHDFPPALETGANSIENQSYKITVDPNIGGISSILDKKRGLEIIDSDKFLANELLALRDVAVDECEAFTGEMWRMRDFPTRVYVAENGPPPEQFSEWKGNS